MASLKDTYDPKDIKNLEMYEDIESSDKNKDDTRYIDSHPDNWKKQNRDWGVIYDDEGDYKFGKLNEEGKFIVDEEVEDDKDEIEVEDKIKVDGGAALSDKIILPKPKPEIEKTGFAKFTSAIGSASENIATELPDKIKEVWDDKDKRRNVLRGLEIINSSSGITSLSQAKSPLGKISEGLLKAESKFAAEDIAKIKAQKKEPRRYPSSTETLLTDTFTEYLKADKDKLKEFKPISERYNLAKKIALDGKELPTGILNKTFSDIKAFLSEIPGGEEAYNSLAKKFSDEDYGSEMKLEDQVIFNDLFQAATFQQVVQEVKKLYPVSNKDIDTLLQTKGDIGSKPEALMRLIAVEMAAKEIYMGSRDLAKLYFENDDVYFERKSILGSEKMIAEKLRESDSVATSTIEELYGKGSAKDVTDAGLITAYYYQSLKSQKVKGEMDAFTIFVTAQKKKEDIKKEKITKYQKSE